MERKKPEDSPTWREVYDLFEKVTSRVTRLEKIVLVLCVIVASPKLGGPSAGQLVAEVARNVV